MRKLFLFVLLAAAALSAGAQEMKDVKFQFTEASDLTVTGKVFTDTPNPYQRMDFTKYSGCWTVKDSTLLSMSSGIIISFRTNSPIISVKPEYDTVNNGNASGFATRGFDLYIRKDGKWLWAGVAASPYAKKAPENIKIVSYMDESLKECILYLPTYSSLKSVKIGTKEGSVIEKGAEPFRHRIALHGSSYMHGSSTTRAALTVPGYLTRMTGLQFCSLGVSGDCKMQPQFANALKDADVEAFVFDSFSNGTAKSIEENLFNFIETIQAAKPGVPMIFMSSIYRERRNFDAQHEEVEAAKALMAEKLMKIAVKKYKDVYFIPSNASTGAHETSVDGVHPGDYGYYLWAVSVKDRILKILAKYGIK